MKENLFRALLLAMWLSVVGSLSGQQIIAYPPISFDELSWRKRSGTTEAMLKLEVETRKIDFIPDAAQKSQLLRFGLSSAFVDSLSSHSIGAEEIAKSKTMEGMKAKLAEAQGFLRYMLEHGSEEELTRERLGIKKLESRVKELESKLQAVEDLLRRR